MWDSCRSTINVVDSVLFYRMLVPVPIANSVELLDALQYVINLTRMTTGHSAKDLYSDYDTAYRAEIQLMLRDVVREGSEVSYECTGPRSPSSSRPRSMMMLSE